MGGDCSNHNAAVISIIARSLLEGLERGDTVLSVPSALQPVFGELDFQRLRAFSGFISKVQHNYLWETFPHSRALLEAWAIELDAFAEYRLRYPPLRPERLNRQQKMARVVGFLEEYLERPHAPSCPGLKDVLRHERIEWELKEMHAGETARLPHQYGDRAYPKLSNHAQLARFNYDPLDIIAQMSTPVPPRVKRRRCYRCYVIDFSAGELRSFELSWPAWSFLGRMDGRRSIAGLLAKSDSERQREFRGLLLQASDMGIVTMLESSAA